MGTVIRPEISVKNRYWLPKHRYYELYHFCLQYPEWKKSYLSLDGYAAGSAGIAEQRGQHDTADPTAVCVQARLHYRQRMEMIEDTAKEAAEDLYLPMLRAVTEGISYEQLNAQSRIPCCKDVWYSGEDVDELNDRPCSVLEMMVALSARCEEHIMDDPDSGNRTGKWFFDMILSLGLINMQDERFDALYARAAISRFLRREHAANGCGGLFTLRYHSADMRRVEIWYQAMWYLDEVIDGERE